MEQQLNQLPDTLILLAAAVLVVAVFRLFRLSPVLGFLFAGAAIGPSGLKLVHDIKQETALAEFGVVFLLFMIGLELSFKKLLEMRSYVLGIGTIQLAITALVICFATFLITHNIISAFVIGSSLALSSTAIVLQVLDEGGARLSQTGRVSFAVLLMQDLAVIPLLVLLPILAGQGGNITYELAFTFVKAMLVLTVLLIVGKILLNPLLRLVAHTKSDELFVATALFLALGASFATEKVGLSPALGAFIAGLLLSESEFQKQVEADILPFKGLLMGLFFMTVGMRFPIAELFNRLPEVMLYSLLLMGVKAAIMIFICRLFKLRWQTCVKSGLLLSQGGEFAFVIFNLATGSNILTPQLGEILLLVVTVTMALTPLAFAVANYGLKIINNRKNLNQIDDTEDLEGHFVLIGFGWVGENVSRLLSMENHSFVAVDQEINRVKAGREMGMQVYYGDASRPEILESLQIKKARAAIITIHDSKQVLRVIQIIHNLYPDIIIIARAKHVENVEAMKAEGAQIVVPEAYESAIQVTKSALQLAGDAEIDIERLVKKFRKSLEVVDYEP